jgi:hypothetical protein
MRFFGLLLISGFIGLPGCGGNTAAQALKHPELPTDTQAKCKVSKSQAEPLIVEWPETARAKLESLSKRGVVAVRYEGCELEVIARCRVKGTYLYSGVTPKQTTRKIRDADELYASLPLGAVKFEGKLQSSGQLNVDMTLVGRYESPAARFSRSDLEGDCDGVTHVVSALSVGSFTFYAGSDASVGASGSLIPGVGGGGKSGATRELLTRDGDEKACIHASSQDKAPPDGCGAMLQLEVAKVMEGSVAAVPVPTPTPTEEPAAPLPKPLPKPYAAPSAASKQCPPGSEFDGILCVASSPYNPSPTSSFTTQDPKARAAPLLMWYVNLGLLGGGLGLGAWALSKATEGASLCNETTKLCPPEALSKRDSAVTIAWVANGFFVAGGATTLLTLLWPTLFGKKATASTAKVHLAPGPASLSAYGEF